MKGSFYGFTKDGRKKLYGEDVSEAVPYKIIFVFSLPHICSALDVVNDVMFARGPKSPLSFPISSWVSPEGLLMTWAATRTLHTSLALLR
jgi:hypothetical protein